MPLITNSTPTIDLHRDLHNFHIDVKMFGAVGDDSNDDTAEIQAAIDAAQAATNGGCVYFPPGIYKITSALNITERLALIGAGPSSHIKQYTNTTDALAFNNNALSHVGVLVRDLVLTTSGGTPRYALRFSGSNEFTMVSLENLLIAGFDTQLYIESAFDGVARNCAFEFGTGTDRGIYMNQGRLLLEKPWFESVTTGIEAVGSVFLTLIEPKFATDVTTHQIVTDNLGFQPAISYIGVSDVTTGLPSVASAATLNLESTGTNVVNVTGTTTITSIVFSWPGRVVTLKFAGILTVTDGSNLKLNGNFVTAANSTLTLACDGTDWFEVGRSIN